MVDKDMFYKFLNFLFGRRKKRSSSISQRGLKKISKVITTASNVIPEPNCVPVSKQADVQKVDYAQIWLF